MKGLNWSLLIMLCSPDRNRMQYLQLGVQREGIEILSNTVRIAPGGIIDFRVQGLETPGITRNYPRFAFSILP